MLMNRRSVFWFAASMIVCGMLATSGFAKKGGNGGGGGGGEDPPSTIPEGLDVRYGVRFIPVPEGLENASVRAVNEQYEAVGDANAACADGARMGFYYAADPLDSTNDVFLTACDMISIDADWTYMQFRDINNRGEIVGYVRYTDGHYRGILVYPANTETGFEYHIIPPPQENVAWYLAHSINDFGDIVGNYKLTSQRSTDPSDAFVYNRGWKNGDGVLPSQPMGLFEYFEGFKVTNARLGLVGGELGWYWYDFIDNSITPDAIPATWNVVGSSTSSHSIALSHDAQIGGYVRTTVKRRSYIDTPGVVDFEGSILWQDVETDGRPLCVNSRSGSNTVGDVLGTSQGSPKWLRHANWGYIVIEDLVVFESAADEESWNLLRESGWNAFGPGVADMSDRVDITPETEERDVNNEFGLVLGSMSSDAGGVPFLLIPSVPMP